MNKQRIVSFGFVLTALFGFQACGVTEEVPQDKPEEVITESIITKKRVAGGYLTGNGEEKISNGGMVINSQADWDALTGKMNSVNDAIAEQSIDFNRVTILAYFDEIRGSGGYVVEITQVKTDGNKLEALVGKSAPSDDAIEIMTQPFVIVTIEKTDKSVMFVD